MRQLIEKKFTRRPPNKLLVITREREREREVKKEGRLERERERERQVRERESEMGGETMTGIEKDRWR